MRILPALLACLMAVVSFAAPEVGQPAPDFTGKTLDGKTVSLADFKARPSSSNGTTLVAPS